MSTENLLKKEGLDMSWSETLLPICTSITRCLKPETWGDDIWDIRKYVNLKKMPGGTRLDSQIIHGVAFSNNVTHKDMVKPIENPKILLLSCPIVYQREGKYINFEALKLQVCSSPEESPKHIHNKSQILTFRKMNI